MDYHLDWLQVAMWFQKCERMPTGTFDMCHDDGSDLTAGTQEDIDLLVAFDEDKSGVVHLVLIEAKGDTSWREDKLSSKSRRLGHVFGTDKMPDDVIPHFVMMSPGELKPEELRNDHWPCWMKHWAHLELPLPNDLLWVTRTDRDSEREGSYRSFVIKTVSKSSQSDAV